jgi:hypothetical protein
MKKIKLIIAISLLSIVGCKKESQCYLCTFGVSNGVQREPEVWCGDPNQIFYDDSSNAISSFCRPIQ